MRKHTQIQILALVLMIAFVLTVSRSIIEAGVMIAIGCAVLLFAFHFNPFIPGQIKNAWLRIAILAVGLIAVVISVIGKFARQ
jgi:hypothetical protein